MTDTELREKAAKATPGPWTVWPEPTPTVQDAIAEFAYQVSNTPCFSGTTWLLNANGLCPASTGSGASSEANAAYIAAASPDVILSLLDRLESAERALSTRPEALVKALQAAERALKPLSDAVFNDNGDMTVSAPLVTADQCISAYFAVRVIGAALVPVIDRPAGEGDGWFRTIEMTVTQAEYDVCRERTRQVIEEGWNAAHDDQHSNGQIARAAAAYAYEAGRTDHQRELDKGIAPQLWPWEEIWWKPTDRRRDLVKAAALIVAEIERLDRASTTPETSP